MLPEGDASRPDPAPAGTRRRGWVAGLLTFFVCGLGQLRCGHGVRALALFGGELVVQTACAVALIHIRVWPMNVGAAVGLFGAWRVFVVRDAVLVARDVPEGFRPPWFATAPVVILILVLLPAYGFRQVALVLRDHVAEAFHVPSRAMSDTILPGDRFLADKLLRREPHRGDVVVYWTGATGAPSRFVHRVIGLPGETVEVRGTRAWIDGRPLDEPYVKGGDDVSRADFGPAVVPAGHYFLLGDWRGRSRDSRVPEVGFVARERIAAFAGTIYFSEDPETGRIRWGRIGRPIR